MKVTHIESHEISLEYVDWLAYPLNHYYGPARRTIYVAHADNGLTGLGESGSPESQETIDRYIGTNPFDWIGDELSLGLGTAMYDLMGKAAKVPVYKLFGKKYRSWVPVGSWTVSTHPDRMAEAVSKYAAQGFMWMKFHLSPFENIFAQTEAMGKVAPEGFKIHYDFTMHGTSDHMPDLLARLARYRIAGCFEDALPPGDIEGYIDLRKRINLPIVLHHCPLGATYEVAMGVADAFMLGHATIGDAARRAGLFAANNIPYMLQNVGTIITRAMTTHMMAAAPSATFHFISATETWKSHPVKERLEPVNGFLRVSEEPGLGVTLDRDELARLTELSLPDHPPWILKSTFQNGSKFHMIARPTNSLLMVRPDRDRHVTLSYDSPVSSEYWDNDGTREYREMFERLEREGVVLEQG